MSLYQNIQTDLKTAMKEKQDVKLSVLRQFLAAVKNQAINNKKQEIEMSDEELVKVLKKEAKKRKDAMVSYAQGGRQELAEQEERELKIIQGYLPAEMDEGQIKIIVNQVVDSLGDITPSDFGRAMKEVMAKVAGQADGKLVSQLVKQQLSKFN